MTRGRHGWRQLPALLVALVLPFVFLPAATASPVHTGVETVTSGDPGPLVTTDHQRVAVLAFSNVAALPIGAALDATPPDPASGATQSRLGVARLVNTVPAVARAVPDAPGRSPPATPE